jgi:NAD(P)-dependent dehydrogenase (short-subunit alcohol dehydrogenase family)
MRPALLVLGATGAIGRGVVAAAVAAGWPVVAIARDAEALRALRARHGTHALRTLAASVSDDASAAALVAALRAYDLPFAGVIVALSDGGGRGRLLDQPTTRLREVFDEVVLPQLAAARHLLPWLAASGRGGSYVLIGGPGGRHPWAGYGQRSVAQAALRMLARALHDEASAHAVRVQLLAVESPVRTEDNRLDACWQWPCAEAIGSKALALIEHRDDGRCAEVVIGYRSQSGDEFTAGDVETALSGSSHAEEMSDPASLLPARCLQQVRKLLETIGSVGPSPAKKNQERTR